MIGYRDFADTELLSRLKENCHESFQKIYRRYWKVCFLQLYRKSGNKELAEELTQNVFVSLWERRSIVVIANLSSYLQTAARYAFINHLKTMLQLDNYADYQKQHGKTDCNNLEEQLAVQDLLSAIEKGINMLPLKTRKIFVLSRLEYQSVKEISRALKISEKAVEYHITQSLKIMRVVLKDYIIVMVLLAILPIA
ncbi:sigma-70 family RNA polymerase sigma factor [Olivibacter sitiensis]|uniref:sigma-70 family RNA polymerase sigma factor n=1 Tax=Olivibacter sitiensis TaxID=376470 RepID=UPI0003F63FAF|nr:sigma-70 family RNA polymerase sigma factor [Olivibacter sitiensis]